MLAHAGVSGWEWHPHPDVWLLIVVLGGLYALALAKVGPTQVKAGEAVASRRRVVLFALGLLALWVHADWPVHDIGEHYLFSVHMVQHIGFTLIAAPLLLLGLPAWLLRWIAKPRGLHFVMTRMTRPLPAALVYNAVVVLSHWPLVVNNALRHHPLHFSVHVVIVVSALLMWFPVVNKVPELPHMKPAPRLIYVFLQSVIPTIPASFLTFGNGVLYEFYAKVPRPFGMTAVEDQQLAGAMMKVYAGLLLWSVIVVGFFRWYASEQREGADEVLTWADVERELARTEPARNEPAAPSPPTP